MISLPAEDVEAILEHVDESELDKETVKRINMAFNYNDKESPFQS